MRVCQYRLQNDPCCNCINYAFQRKWFKVSSSNPLLSLSVPLASPPVHSFITIPPSLFFLSLNISVPPAHLLIHYFPFSFLLSSSPFFSTCLFSSSRFHLSVFSPSFPPILALFVSVFAHILFFSSSHISIPPPSNFFCSFPAKCKISK